MRRRHRLGAAHDGLCALTAPAGGDLSRDVGGARDARHVEVPAREVAERIDEGAAHSGRARAEDVGRVDVAEVERARRPHAEAVQGEAEDPRVRLLHADETAVDHRVEVADHPQLIEEALVRGFDPEKFDLSAVNKKLATLSKRVARRRK